MQALALGLMLLTLAPKPGEEKPKAEELDGRWEVTSATFNGKENANVKGRFLQFLGDTFTTFEGEKAGRTVNVKMDAKAKPKEIDMERPDGTKAEGIYSIEKDEMKICYAEPGNKRPTKFESKEGDKVFLLVLKRVKVEE